MDKLIIEYESKEMALLQKEILDQMIKENPKIKNREQAIDILFESYFHDVKKMKTGSISQLAISKNKWLDATYTKLLYRAKKEIMKTFKKERKKEIKIMNSQIKEMMKIVREDERTKMKSKIKNLKNANDKLFQDKKQMEKKLNLKVKELIDFLISWNVN